MPAQYNSQPTAIDRSIINTPATRFDSPPATSCKLSVTYVHNNSHAVAISTSWGSGGATKAKQQQQQQQQQLQPPTGRQVTSGHALSTGHQGAACMTDMCGVAVCLQCVQLQETPHGRASQTNARAAAAVGKTRASHRVTARKARAAAKGAVMAPKMQPKSQPRSSPKAAAAARALDPSNRPSRQCRPTKSRHP